MDYYTYQERFAENLNEFIKQQFILPNTNSEPINYPCTVSQLESSIPADTNDLANYPLTVSLTNPYCDPPPVISESHVDIALPTVLTNCNDVKTDDELWIETWLSQIGKIHINLSPTVEINSIPEPVKSVNWNLPIHVAKASLTNCFHVLDQLQQMQDYLKTNVAVMPTLEWNNKTMEIGLVKEHFSKLISQFEHPEVITSLRLVVEKRRKKRLAQKRRKRNRRNCITEMLEHRHKLHKDIDNWLESMKEEVERAKVEENMKKEADSVLAEVTKKKSDARKLLSLIQSLVKLRYVREQTAINRGDKVSLEDSIAFTKATERLDKIWNDALNVYTKEEQGLRMMLEETAVEDNNAARAARERKITHEWDAALFGPKRMPSAAYWGLMAAEKDVETFIAIRKSWDTFLTDANDENGSSIPIGWVMPNPCPEQNWIKYLNAF